MTTTKNYELELMEARKASPDWFGIQVLTGLVAAGSGLFQEERDTARINAMSPDRKAKAVDLITRWSELYREVIDLNKDIDDELQGGIK